METTSHLPHHHHRGFTLPEVLVAIGIAAVGILSVLGIVPRSLDTLRKAGEVSAESRIAQQIFATISLSEWQDSKARDQLESNYQGKRYFFDDLAVPVEEPDPAFGPAYVAEVSIAPLDVALPQGGSTAAAPDPHLRRVTVKVATAPSPDFDFNTAEERAYRSYASVVTRTGK
jgi:uncharacterized protein (TIGR02598 family)